MTRDPGFVEDPEAHEPAPSVAAIRAAQAALDTGGPMLLDATSGEARARINPRWEPDLVPTQSPGLSPLSWLACGIGILFLSWCLLSLMAFAEEQLQRSSALGALTLAVFGIAFVLVLYGLWGERRAFRALRQVDDLRRRLSRTDLTLPELRAVVLPWLGMIRSHLGDPRQIVTLIEGASSPGEIKNTLRQDVAGLLWMAAKQAGKRAALEGGAVVAVTPAPALEGVFVGIRGLLLIRQVAGIYGVRPGFLVTLALLRRVAWTAAGVSGSALLSQTLAEHALQKMPVIKHLAGALPETSLAAVRLYRLATITAEACSPIGRGSDK